MDLERTVAFLVGRYINRIFHCPPVSLAETNAAPWLELTLFRNCTHSLTAGTSPGESLIEVFSYEVTFDIVSNGSCIDSIPHFPRLASIWNSFPNS